MIDYIIFIKVFLLAHLIVKFEPLNWILDAIKPLFEKNVILNLIYNIITLATSCLKCTSFWLGWSLGGFWCGVTMSFIAYLWTQLIQPTIDKIRFQ